MTPNPNSSPERRLLRIPEVLARIGMRRSWLYKEMSAGRFPRCIKAGRASVWDSWAIEQYVVERAA